MLLMDLADECSSDMHIDNDNYHLLNLHPGQPLAGLYVDQDISTHYLQVKKILSFNKKNTKCSYCTSKLGQKINNMCLTPVFQKIMWKGAFLFLFFNTFAYKNDI